MAVRMYNGGDKVFVKACELAGVKPTRRQRKKYDERTGSAYLHYGDALRSVNIHQRAESILASHRRD